MAALGNFAHVRAPTASTWDDFHAIVGSGEEIPVERRARWVLGMRVEAFVPGPMVGAI